MANNHIAKNKKKYIVQLPSTIDLPKRILLIQKVFQWENIIITSGCANFFSYNLNYQDESK